MGEINEASYQVAFELVMYAGNSRSCSLMAMEAAREARFEDAEQHLKEAEEELKKAHDAQTGMLAQEAGGNQVELNIILVHAQDHLTMAMVMKDNAEEFLNLYRMVYELKGQKA